MTIIFSGASTVSMMKCRNRPSMQVRSVRMGVKLGAVIRETNVNVWVGLFLES